VIRRRVAEVPRIDTTTCYFRNFLLGEVVKIDPVELYLAVFVRPV
jgi:hypothetical protein